MILIHNKIRDLKPQKYLISDFTSYIEVGQTLKSNLNNWLADEGLNVISDAADKVVEQCKKDATAETGWCKVRDAFILPH